jgi:hypothetical protein
MARQYGHEKLDLLEALRLLAGTEPLRFGRLVSRLVAASGCSERAGKDALAILRRGHYIEPVPVGGDGRGRAYRVGERGQALLAHPHGWLVLRLARKLFTSCPSRAGARWQGRVRDQGGLEAELERVEQLVLVRPPQAGRRGDRPPGGGKEQGARPGRTGGAGTLAGTPLRPSDRTGAGSRRAQAERTMLAGAAAMVVGVVAFRPRDLLAALTLGETIERDPRLAELRQARRERDAFEQAVRALVPEATWRRIVEDAQQAHQARIPRGEIDQAAPPPRPLLLHDPRAEALLLPHHPRAHAAGPSSPQQAAAERLLDAGLDLLSAAKTIVEPREALAAAAFLHELDAKRAPALYEELQGQFTAFTSAVKKHVPKEQWPALYQEFERLLAASEPRPPMPPRRSGRRR